MASRAISAVARPVVRAVVARPAVVPVVASATRALSVTSTSRRANNNNSSRASGARNAGYFAAALVVAGGMMVHSASADEKKAAPAAKPVDYAAVRKAIVDLLEVEGYDDGSRGPLLVRLAWHAAGTYDKVSKTGGSDGATMRYLGESGHGANAGLAIARDALEVVKKQFPDISYADLWTLAGGVAIEEMGGPTIAWRPGRSDFGGPASPVPDGRLPDAAQGAQHVRDIFYRMGFNDQEIVALLGAHSLGRCHEDRSGFKGPWTRAPTTFSNEFFRVLLEEQWTENKTYTKARQFQDKTGELMMLPADLALVQDPAFKKYVEVYAKDEQKFFKDFAAAWTKLMELGCNNLAAAPANTVATISSGASLPPPLAVTAPAAAAATAAAASAPTTAKASEKPAEVSWWKKIFGGK